MHYELSPNLKQCAESYLQTKSELVGQDYAASRLKRMFDIAVASSAALPALMVIAATAPVIWTYDRHHPFVDAGNSFANGEHTPFWKLRTMTPDAKEHEVEVFNGMTASEFKRNGKHDPRITRVGKYLRERSIDETPQVFNVLLGHLSVVSPRIPVESDWNLIYQNKDEEPYQRFIENALLTGNHGRKRQKFGVTGFYAIMGREKLNDKDRFALDVLYWEQQSFWADMRILASSFLAFRNTRGR